MKRLIAGIAVFALGAAPASADPKGDVMAAMIAFGKATSYHMTIASRNRPGTMEADMVAPGKMHVVTAQFEMIKIDTTTWVKMNGSWQKFALPGMDQMMGGVNGVLAAVHASPDQLTVTDLGPKSPAAGGPALHAYSITNEAGKSPSTIFLDGTQLVEADTSDGTSVRFSKFNAPVDIEPPS
jgi:hypothetical protein